MSTEYTRDELLAICESAFTPEDNWSDRDSASAHRQLGEAYALLRAGCEFTVLRGGRLNTNAWTVWLEIKSKGFGVFDWGGDYDSETYYLPTRERLAQCPGEDWY